MDRRQLFNAVLGELTNEIFVKIDPYGIGKRIKNYYKHKQTFDTIITLTDILNLAGVDVDKRKELKYKHILTNPDKVFWDFAEHYTFVGRDDLKDRKINWDGIHPKIKVSTNGEIIYLGEHGLVNIDSNSYLTNNGYSRFKFDGVTYSIHRIVSSTFIPAKDSTPKLKIVNHKNGVKNHNNVLNLEWCDFTGNIKHAMEMGLKPNSYLLMTVTANNLYKGRSFVLQDKNEISELGVSKNGIWPKVGKVYYWNDTETNLEDVVLQEDFIK